MALENYFRMVFSNGSEVFINDNSGTVRDFLKSISDGIMTSEFVGLQRIHITTETEPIYYKKTSIISVQKINQKIIGSSDKIWRLTK